MPLSRDLRREQLSKQTHQPGISALEVGGPDIQARPARVPPFLLSILIALIALVAIEIEATPKMKTGILGPTRFSGSHCALYCSTVDTM